MWMYNCTGRDRKTGEEFVLESPVDDTPKWNKQNHYLFSQKFKDICFTLLAIQKHYPSIDKNIFLLLIQKISIGNMYLIDFVETPFHIFLNVMKRSEEEMRRIYRKIEYSNLTYSTSFGVTDTRFVNVDEEIHSKGVISVEKRGKELNYRVLKENSLYEISIGLSFNFFLEKEKRKQLYYELIKTYTEVSSDKKSHILNRFLFVFLFIFIFSFLYFVFCI